MQARAARVEVRGNRRFGRRALEQFERRAADRNDVRPDVLDDDLFRGMHLEPERVPIEGQRLPRGPARRSRCDRERLSSGGRLASLGCVQRCVSRDRRRPRTDRSHAPRCGRRHRANVACRQCLPPTWCRNLCDHQLAQPRIAAAHVVACCAIPGGPRGTARSRPTAREPRHRSSLRSSGSAAASRRPRTSEATGCRHTACTTRSAPSRSALFTTKMSAISMMPALSACTSSPAPGHQHDDGDVGRAATSTSSCPTPTVSMMTMSLARRIQDRAPRRSSPAPGRPSCPRVAMLRMNTPSSPACRPIRTRSPRMAPPVKGLVGSTAITPTARPARTNVRHEPIDQRALAGTRRPGHAHQVRPSGSSEDLADQCGACGRLVLDERNRPRDRTRIASENPVSELCHALGGMERASEAIPLQCSAS